MITGKKLEMARKIKGLSQEYVASKLNISQAKLSNMSNSEKEISDELLKKYLQILEVNEEWVEKLDNMVYIIQNNVIEKNDGNGFVMNIYEKDKSHINSLLKVIDDLHVIIAKMKKQ